MITADAQQLEPGGRITVTNWTPAVSAPTSCSSTHTCRVVSSGGRARSTARGRSSPAALNAPATNRRIHACA